MESGEDIRDGAVREVVEETGWVPGPVEKLTTYHPSNGLSDQTFHLFLARGARQVGRPADWYESERVEWVPVSALRRHLAAGEVADGLTVTALCWCLAFGLLS